MSQRECGKVKGDKPRSVTPIGRFSVSANALITTITTVWPERKTGKNNHLRDAKRFGNHGALLFSVFFLLQSRPLHVPIVPMSVKVPVALSMLYMETVFELEFVT